MFPSSDTSTSLPDTFFRRLLREISDIDELKVTLYALWRLEHMDEPYCALAAADFDATELGLGPDAIASGLAKAEQRGSLLKSAYDGRTFYFLNSPGGRSAAKAFERGEWPESAQIISLPLERPNVFQLYEENIGPLTPLLADALKDAEQTFSPGWVADAIALAVKHNKRSWKYCEGILKRWKEEGRAEKQSGRDDQASRQRDVEGKIKKFFGGGAG